MFYIKTKLPDGKTVKTDVTDENVFTRCPECGKEIGVDLAELFFPALVVVAAVELHLVDLWTAQPFVDTQGS